MIRGSLGQNPALSGSFSPGQSTGVSCFTVASVIVLKIAGVTNREFQLFLLVPKNREVLCAAQGWAE